MPFATPELYNESLMLVPQTVVLQEEGVVEIEPVVIEDVQLKVVPVKAPLSVISACEALQIVADDAVAIAVGLGLTVAPAYIVSLQPFLDATIL